MTFVVATFDVEGVATASGFPGGQGAAAGLSGPNVAIHRGGAFTQLRKGENSADKLRYGDERVNRVYYGPLLVSILGYENLGDFTSDGVASVSGQSGMLAKADGVATAEAESGTPATAEADGVATVTGVAGEEEFMTFIASIDLSNDATADFTGFDAGQYDAYLFVLQNVIPAIDSVTLQMLTSTDGGNNWDTGGSDYAYHFLIINDSGDPDTLQSGSDSKIPLTSKDVGGDTGEDGVSGHVWVLGPHLAKRTHVTVQLSWQDNTGAIFSMTGSGMRKASEDVDAVRFLFDSDNLESGTITMYGLKNS